MDIAEQVWDTPDAWSSGTCAGVRVDAEGLRLSTPAELADGVEYGTWTSPEQELGFAAHDLVVSWNAPTPPGTWLTVDVRVRTGSGSVSRWYTMARWAHGDGDIARTSVPGQRDETARVEVDRLIAAPGTRVCSAWLRVGLARTIGTDATPTVSSVRAMASAPHERTEVVMSAPGPARGVELAVPRYAQRRHEGRFPEYGGGGGSWCAPACTEMLVEYWGVGPTRGELSWLPTEYPDRTVAHAARHTYDHAYAGTGNWTFNTAYAAQYGLRAHVTRLRDLAELEHHVAAGRPVVTSQSFEATELPGAGYATAGHLMVVVGFTVSGDVIVHDPAADSADAVRRVYPRAPFETVWQRTKRHTATGAVADGPGGIAYLVS